MNVSDIFKRKVINKKRLITVLILFLLVVVMILSNPDVWNYLFGTDPVKISFQSGLEYKAMAYGDDMLLVSNEGIRAVDESGKELWTNVFSMTSPVTVVKDDYIMVADINGRSVFVYDEEENIYQVKSPENILAAKLNEDGYTAVASNELGYKGVVSVYNNDGEECFKWHSGAGYIGDIDLSSDGILAVAQIMTDRAQVYSNVIYINTNGNGNAQYVDEVDGIVMKIRFNDAEELVAVSEGSMRCYDESGKKKYVVNFDGRIPVNCNIENDDNLVLAFEGGVNNTVLESYSEAGECRGKYSVDSKIRCFDVNDEYILYSTAGKVCYISPEGDFESEMTTSIDSRQIKIFADHDSVMVVGGSSAEILKID